MGGIGLIELQKVRLGDICKFQNGYAFKSKDFIRDGQYNVVKIKELKNGKVKFFEDTATIDLNIDEYENYSIFKGDVLFALTGDPVNKNNPLSWVGRVAIYKEDNVSLLNQRVCKVITEEDKILKEYVYYYFRVFENFYSLAAKATGSASQANISTKTIADTEMMIPSVETQKKIVKLLSALDDKIDNNNQINDNLQQQIQMFFNKICVASFDSVPMATIIDVRDGTHDSPKVQAAGFSLITSKHLLPFGVDKITANLISESDYLKINERSKVDTNDILLSMIGTVGLVSLVTEELVDFAIKNVALFKTSNCIELIYFIHCYLCSDSTKQNIERCLAGSTQKYISLGELRKLPVCLPDRSIIQHFNSIVKPIYDLITVNVYENKKLITLRDAILPKAMSGYLDVSDICI